MVARAQSKGTIKVGFVTPATGPLAPFGETDGWAVDKVRQLLAKGLGDLVGQAMTSRSWCKDGQSDPNRAAEVAGDLILNDGVHLIVPASTTDTVSPVADQAELNECPCISTGAPWQAIIFPRGGADKPFKWTYHFFWGLDEALEHLRRPVEHASKPTARSACCFRRTPMAKPGATRNTACRCRRKKAGFEIVVPGYFQPRTNDYTAQINAFKKRAATSSAA